MRSVIAFASCAVILALVANAVVQKERHLESGKVVILELAPVDPRSLMQGDYMALRFKIANDALPALPKAETKPGVRHAGLANADGRIVAELDTQSVARYRRLDDGTPLAANEILLRYRVREGQMKFATNAYFFQEGSAKRYEVARFGEFRIVPSGDMLLTQMRDKDLKPL